MARAGLYKSDVKKARDALMAQGRHPSLDAIRIELGNTGSKTTIHKYLKELEEEEGSANPQASVSEAVLDLVERLAMQLESESAVAVDLIRSQAAEREENDAKVITGLKEQVDLLAERLQEAENKYAEVVVSRDNIREQMQQESLSRHTAEQQVQNLQERLLENDEHRRSLEEKHQHAREALEHYRSSVKEQREQDAHRHEHQIQQLQAEQRQLQQSLIVKQEEVTRLNQEGARLVSELSHAQLAVRDRDARLNRLEQKLEVLGPLQERCKHLETQLEAQAKAVNERQAQCADFERQLQCLQAEFASARAKNDANEQLITELKGLLGNRRPLQTDA